MLNLRSPVQVSIYIHTQVLYLVFDLDVIYIYTSTNLEDETRM